MKAPIPTKSPMIEIFPIDIGIASITIDNPNGYYNLTIYYTQVQPPSIQFFLEFLASQNFVILVGIFGFFFMFYKIIRN